MITGLGDAGGAGIARYAHRRPAASRFTPLLGGFDLGGLLFEPLIPRVLDDLAR